MKRYLLNSFASLLILMGCSALAADDSSALQGKWSVQKTAEDGKTITQTVEFKKDKFIFELKKDDKTLHAEGDIKIEKQGPFKSIRFYHIKAGETADDLQEVGEERTLIYVLDDNTWTAATNFEEDHTNEKQTIDVYKRVTKKAADAK